MTTDVYATIYTPVIVAALIGVIFIWSTLFVGNLLAPRIRDRTKSAIYECGMQPVGQGWSQMNLRYYLYAFVFLIFEVDVIFLFPWVVVLESLGPFAFWEMMLFLAMLLFGLAYAWRKGVLKWE
jgi:NADH-quinone oxidoreductase subunit A